MKINSKWRRKWHDELALEENLKIHLEAWHDSEMDVGLIMVSYSGSDEANKTILEKFAYVGDYRQTIRRAMGIWSKEIPRFVRTIRGESVQEELGGEEDEPEEQP